MCSGFDTSRRHCGLLLGVVVTFSAAAADEPTSVWATQLAADARSSLQAGPFSVLQKTGVAPSGDPHDFFTQPPYLWPNPKKPDGIPYVRRDGRLNPEASSDRFDRVSYFEMAKHAQILSLAWKHTQQEQYAERAVLLIRTWFLDPATRMNPNFRYAQLRPGQSRGSQYGIIRGMSLLELHSCRHWLANSNAWTAEDEAGWRQWMSEYVEWLQSSDLGARESRARNNHGTWYDLQLATFAAYVGDHDTASEVLEDVKHNRIDVQIEPDGRQTKELGRTKSWSYSVMNLRGLFLLAEQAQEFDIDLWNYESADGRSLKAALRYLLPSATGNRNWPHRNIEEWRPQLLTPLLPLAAEAYDDNAIRQALTQLDPDGRIQAGIVLARQAW